MDGMKTVQTQMAAYLSSRGHCSLRMRGGYEVVGNASLSLMVTVWNLRNVHPPKPNDEVKQILRAAFRECIT